MPHVASERWSLFPASEFEHRADQWDELVAASGYPAFMRADFVWPALCEFGTGRERLAVCGSSGRPVAMALLATARLGVWQTFQPSQLPLGAVVHDGSRSMEERLRALFPSLPGIALSIAVTQQDPDIVPRPRDTLRLQTLAYIDTARVVIDQPFESYWAARGKNLRTNVKRQFAKLAQGNAKVHLDVVADRADVGAAIADYGALESAGWKAAEGTAVGRHNAQGRFYTRVFETFCALGRGRIYRYVIDGKVAAMDLCLHDAGVVIVLKTAYDESLSKLSPATLMRYEYFRALFDGGAVKRIEFYGKVMDWHRRWTDDVRTLYHVNQYRAAWLRTVHARFTRSEAGHGSAHQ